MKPNKIFVLLFIFVLMSTFFVGCEKDNDGLYDLLERKITLPSKIERVVCIGASALRLYCYVGDVNLLCGVEDFEKSDLMPVRPYAFAYQDIFENLPSVGSGGADSSPDEEKIIACNPDIIFSLYNNREQMDKLQQTTGVPVVCLSYGGSDPFGENVKKSISLLGTILNREDRSNALIAQIEKYKEDLSTRSALSACEKKTVYLGCNTYNGGKGTFGDTLVRYSAFEILDARNPLLSKKYLTNNPTLDYETLLDLNPDIVLIDIANENKLLREYLSRPDVFSALKAFQTDNVYEQMPYNQYYTNLEIAVCDAYFLGNVLYPDSFSDIDLTTVYDEICSAFLQKDLSYYERTCSFYGKGYGKISLNA